MSRRFILILVALIVAIAASDVMVSRLRSPRAAQATRVRPSRALADAFMDVLCRQPTDEESVDWDTRPFDRSSLESALGERDEARRVRAIRALFFTALRRQPTLDDCPRIRDWAERGVGLDVVRRELDESPEARRIARVRQVFIDLSGWDPLGWDEEELRRWADSPFTIAEIRSRLRHRTPLVGVHYFAWYQRSGDGWRNDLTIVPAGSPRPAIGQYDSSDLSVVNTQIAQMENAGFDFIIVHVIAQSERTWRNAHLLFDALGAHHVRAAVMLDGLNKETAAAKTMWTTKAIREFARDPHYMTLHGEPLVMLFSAPIDFDVPGALLRNVYWTDRYDPGRNTFNLGSRLDSHDWLFWADTPQPLVNGATAVIPGYTDESLGRARTMIHPRDNGAFYRGQWQRALALHPELILVYSWNEYFERTAIEPTDAWGDQYLKMTACFISHAHRGTGGTC